MLHWAAIQGVDVDSDEEELTRFVTEIAGAGRLLNPAGLILHLWITVVEPQFRRKVACLT